MTELVLQPCPAGFCWDILTRSAAFQRYLAYVRVQQLLVDPGCYAAAETELQPADYPLVIQKSPLWFRLRQASLGTGSSLGKYLKCRRRWPSLEQVTAAWQAKLTGQEVWAPDQAAQGHMRWGVNYEEPAAVHFAVNQQLKVTAVGAIHLPIQYIIGRDTPAMGHGGLPWPSRPDLLSGHLLISPDGLVSRPSSCWLLGLLEIKCISPFHHVAEPDGRLTWAADMESRQWQLAGQIPLVYLIQLGLQALAAQYYYPTLKDDGQMWFIRWSPAGYSQFSCRLATLIAVGVRATQLYLLLLERLSAQPAVLKDALSYTETERPVLAALEAALEVVSQELDAHYSYYEHAGMYPEFWFYQQFTKMHTFAVEREL